MKRQRSGIEAEHAEANKLAADWKEKREVGGRLFGLSLCGRNEVPRSIKTG
jgi:hypothetical protein